MKVNSINPFTGKVVFSHQTDSSKKTDGKLMEASASYSQWRGQSLESRIECVKNLASVFESNKEILAHTASIEMGKPFSEAIAEVEKCILCCNYYAEEISQILKPIQHDTSAKTVYEPMGAVLGIMPWNFPYWQVIRFAIPALLSGNVVLLKHAPNTWECAKLIERMMLEADFPKGVFQNVFVSVDAVEEIIANKLVTGIAFTGSVKAGKTVAMLAGKYLKKCTLELGGNNALLVFPDADIDAAIEAIFAGRMGNNGQSCIAVKRVVVHEQVYKQVKKRLKGGFQARQDIYDDPVKASTLLGPLARKDLAKQLETQVKLATNAGAKLLVGGKRKRCYFEPTLLEVSKTNSVISEQEFFGPVLSLLKAKTVEEMIHTANNTPYGLGVSLFSQDVEKMMKLSRHFEEGQVFINDIVKSNPAYPFGGVKNSGIGKELGVDGALEFVNKKTIVVTK